METEDLLESIDMGKELYCDEIDLERWAKKYLEEEVLVKEEPEWSGMYMEDVEIEVGDVCKVTDTGCTYTSYPEFSDEAGYPELRTERYVTSRNYQVVKDKEVRVLFVKQDPEEPLRQMIAIVETTSSPEYFKFMINTRGLKLVHSKKDEVKHRRSIYLKRYMFGGPLSKMVPDDCVSDSLLEAIVLKNPMDIQYVSSYLLIDGDYKKVLYKDGGLLGLIPEDRRSIELCRIAVGEEPYAEKFVPEELRIFI